MAVRGLASSARPSPKHVVVSGIQPTGVPHLGNYLGALKLWVDLQNSAAKEDELVFFIASLHALTVPQNPVQLNSDRRHLMATLLAIGLDPQRCTLFYQDQVPEHTELMWILACATPFGRLERMTTWKSKLATLLNSASTDKVDESLLQLGLFAYPTLQAADILLYHATQVPVGDDQTQHLELTRDTAQSYNRLVKQNYFPIPAQLYAESKRISSLRNPDQKMSKSAPDANSRILLTDTPEQIQSKFKRAVTDSEPMLTYDPENRPAVSNLISILSGLGGGVLRAEVPDADMAKFNEPAFVADTLNRVTGGSGAALKRVLTESVVEELQPIQAEYHRLVTEGGYLESLERLGRDKARARASRTMDDVRKHLGLCK